MLFFWLMVQFNAYATPQQDDIKIKVDELSNTTNINFTSALPFKAAVFLRNNKLWFVFDRLVDLKIKDTILSRNDTLKSLKQLTINPNATIAYAEIINPNDVEITASRENNNWIIKITPYDNTILASEIASNRNIVKYIGKQPYVDVQLYAKKGNIISFNDPFIGDIITTIPEDEVARSNQYLFVDFKILNSIIGIVLQPLNDDLNINFKDKNLRITSSTMLNISSQIINNQFTNNNYQGNILHLSQYVKAPEDFNKTLNHLNYLVATSTDYTTKGQHFYNLAMFFLANKWYLEAKSILLLVQKYSNLIENNHETRMVMGVLYLLCDEIDEANDIIQSIDLNLINIHQRAEVLFWQKLCKYFYSLKHKNNTHTLNSIIKTFNNHQYNFLNKYENSIIQKIAFKTLEAITLMPKPNANYAKSLIQLLEKTNLQPRDNNMLEYYIGKYLILLHSNEAAVEHFKNCANNINDLYFYPRCNLELADLLLNDKIISINQYINVLQLLTTLWRGDAFEIQILEKLFSIYDGIDDIGNSMRILRIIIAAYPHTYHSFVATNSSTKSLINYFKSSNDSTIHKLSIFYEFRDFIPLGNEGDQIIIKVVSYLIDLNLLEQAVQILEHQIKNRLIGISKEKAINGLMNIYNDMHEWHKAIKLADDNTQLPFNMNNPLIAQRKYIYTNAMINMAQSEDAIAILYGDNERSADAIRAKAFFKLQNWSDFNDNSEPYLYLIRNKQNFDLTAADKIRILQQNISYFNTKQTKLLNNLFLDFKVQLQSQDKESVRNKLFYQITNDLNSGLFISSPERRDKLRDLVKQIANS